MSMPFRREPFALVLAGRGPFHAPVSMHLITLELAVIGSAIDPFFHTLAVFSTAFPFAYKVIFAVTGFRTVPLALVHDKNALNSFHRIIPFFFSLAVALAHLPGTIIRVAIGSGMDPVAVPLALKRLSFISAAVTLSTCTLPVLNTLKPFSLIHAPVTVGVPTLAMTVTIAVFSLISVPVCPHINAVSMLFVVAPLTLILSAICSRIRPLAVFLALAPLSLVATAASIQIDANAVPVAIVPFTVILRATGPLKTPSTVHFALQILSLVPAPVRKRLDAATGAHVAAPFPCVLVPVGRGQDAAPVPIVFHKISVVLDFAQGIPLDPDAVSFALCPSTDVTRAVSFCVTAVAVLLEFAKLA
eukprot:CAMPEP_0179425520 /NCGR_PEP_ID=MMETSP0799-20121207/12214_1 /TAXON_ID=46947 /ORGANISM="Geminigera cryophila, Strain CCMP2564" /LENGTH=358 /DNA_ID=CAMNT_0021200141 /DNA_START=5362 /DNA_END=6438 /DNA_ORIENTATION=+